MLSTGIHMAKSGMVQVRVAYLVTPEQADLVRAMSFATDETQSSIIRRAIEGIHDSLTPEQKAAVARVKAK